MGRSWAWRKGKADAIVARLYKQDQRSWFTANWSIYASRLEYSKRNSIDETVTVYVKTDHQYREYMLHQAKLRRDNRVNCSCSFCGNVRRQGNGNAFKTLSYHEQIAAISASEQITESDIQPT